jgi:glycosyltransferase involved in cell wall biosynthesis
MLVMHRAKRTWQQQVTRYISLTDFARAKFIEAGFAGNHIRVKPNFLASDPGFNETLGNYMIYIGRLTPEKGVFTLLAAWKSLPDIPLKIVGDGPAFNQLHEIIEQKNLENVELLGSKPSTQTMNLLKEARALLFPSEWYETFGRVAIEAFACRVPVIASRIGAIAEVVTDGENGFYFTPGAPREAAAAVRRLWDNPSLAEAMANSARRTYETRYKPDKNYQMLMSIYEEVTRRKNQQ